MADGRQAFGSDPATTNQRMEIRAALEAVRALDGDLVIFSDSRYVVDCFDKEWWRKWLKRDWTRGPNKPVANRDLWEPLVELVLDRGTVTFRWIKGHSGHPMNDLADRLAVAASTAHAPAMDKKRLVIPAKFESRCQICQNPIVPGVDMIERTVDFGWIHKACSV